MLRKTVIALAATTLIGCSAGGTFSPLGSKSSGEQAQLAAYAATARYPGDAKPSTDLRAAALINPKSDAVKIVNLSDQPVRDANVWVNGTFVRKVNIVPAHGAVVLDRSEFFDASGQNMTKLNAPVHKVEIQTGDHLYALGDARTD